MATYEAIAATSEALLRLLREGCPSDEFAGAQFRLYQVTDFQKPMAEGVSLLLYRVSINTGRRNLPPSTSPDGKRCRPPLPVDLHYLLSAWGKTPEMQQRLLGWCLRALDDVPILPSGLLNQNEPLPQPFRNSEAVELICDPLSLQDLAQVWDVIKPNVPLSMAYVARLVPLESKTPLRDEAPVQVREFQLTAGPA